VTSSNAQTVSRRDPSFPRRPAGGAAGDGSPAQIHAWSAVEERARQNGAGARTRPSPPQWLLRCGLNGSSVEAVHTGECRAAAKTDRCRPVTRQQAITALPPQVPACVHLPAGHGTRHLEPSRFGLPLRGRPPPDLCASVTAVGRVGAGVPVAKGVPVVAFTGLGRHRQGAMASLGGSVSATCMGAPGKGRSPGRLSVSSIRLDLLLQPPLPWPVYRLSPLRSLRIQPPSAAAGRGRRGWRPPARPVAI
jgi:hypothetical protein